MNRILQIIPAKGWYAIHNENVEGQPMREVRIRLACWALVEDDDGHREVVGMDALDTVEITDEGGTFERYEHESGEITVE